MMPSGLGYNSDLLLVFFWSANSSVLFLNFPRKQLHLDFRNYKYSSVYTLYLIQLCFYAKIALLSKKPSVLKSVLIYCNVIDIICNVCRDFSVCHQFSKKKFVCEVYAKAGPSLVGGAKGATHSK